MPAPSIKAIAKQAGLSVDKIEKYWEKAKEIALKKFAETDTAYWPYVMGIVKNMAGIGEEMKIADKLNVLLEGDVRIIRKGRAGLVGEYQGRRINIDVSYPGPGLELWISDKQKPKMMKQVKGYVIRSFKQGLDTAKGMIDDGEI